jgi:hypothetical protein
VEDDALRHDDLPVQQIQGAVVAARKLRRDAENYVRYRAEKK